MALTLAAFSFVTYEIVEHRLAQELDRQLRIDFDLVEGQIDIEPSGALRWAVTGAHGDEGFARLAAWFEIWSEDGRLLLRHWPVQDAAIVDPLPPPHAGSLRFYGVDLGHDLPVRIMERPARLRDIDVIMRLIRDETGMRRTLAEITEVFLVSLPAALLLASVGGYLLARRSLRPVASMAAHAQRITSESLSARLPTPHPADEFGRLATVFNDTLQRLENSFAELRRFTADASHELRTPLTALRTVGEVALRERADARALREVIGSMLEEVERLNGLIESLLTLARLEGSVVVPQREVVDVQRVVSEVGESLAVLASEKGQRIDWRAEPDLLVASDPMLLRQALLNIVHNAIRHSPASGIVSILAKRSGDCVEIAVTDQGPGIAAEHQQRVFDRFYRVNPARARTEGGHGLGLSIAKWSVERVGGHIDLVSMPGNGCTFRIVLPA